MVPKTEVRSKGNFLAQPGDAHEKEQEKKIGQGKSDDIHEKHPSDDHDDHGRQFGDIHFGTRPGRSPFRPPFRRAMRISQP